MLDPATGTIIGDIPEMDVPDVRMAIQAASEAFGTWKKETGKVPTIPWICVPD